MGYVPTEEVLGVVVDDILDLPHRNWLSQLPHDAQRLSNEKSVYDLVRVFDDPSSNDSTIETILAHQDFSRDHLT
jgi:hypothetical protein